MNIAEYKLLLQKFVSFKSISTDLSYKNEMQGCAKFLSDLFTDNGFTVELIQRKNANPVVYAYYNVNTSVKTVLVYGHYDVQPASTKDPDWFNDPFELFERDKRFYGRGVADNKGQILIHIFTAINLIKEKKLNYNVKFIIEGDEETGESLSVLVKQRSDIFKVDTVLVSDGEILGQRPTLEAGFRGGFNTLLTVETGQTNLHSGMYGGAVPSASHTLINLLSKIVDNNNVLIPEFYKDVEDISDVDKADWLGVTKEDIIKVAQVKDLLINDISFFAQTGLMPTVQISGIKSGYIDEGFSNIVPAKAEARLNFRLVANQDPVKEFEKFKRYVLDSTPVYASVDISISGPHMPVKLNTNNQDAKKVLTLLEKVYKQKPVVKYVGGAIPFIVDVKECYGIETLSVSLANEDCNMHGVNENFKIDLLEKGLEFSKLFFQK